MPRRFDPPSRALLASPADMAETPGTPGWRDLGTAWNAVIEMFAATLFYGALGWFADSWLGTGHVLFVLGLLGGNALGLYVVAKRLAHADAEYARRRGRARAG